MNTALKITAFTAGLATSFAAAYGVGHAVGAPVAKPSSAAHAGHTPAAPAAPAASGGEHLPGGLQISEGGYTLSLDNAFVTADAPTDLRFRILGADGKPVTAYQPAHEKELHLIVAPRDLATFQHLHPARAADGTWSARAALPAAGEYRVYADFTPAGAAQALTLGADLHAAGELRPVPLPETGRTVTVDGYAVTLNGDLTAGRSTRLTLTVAKDGKPVTDLEPCLGAYGHLVALRAGDLAYLHVHPDTGAPGPDIAFTTTAPSVGSYRLFLDFQHGGTVRTAAFTVATGAAPVPTPQAQTQAPAPTTAAPEPGGAHQH
ncbi:hypothetical protein ADK60_01220 [Streptomyces sp. XY431]|uniref:hypothetical protein n=1 Tax=Streptomyces sp. XY431 TaxID=1415562 RepID=UPI0006AE12CB|nr:hypothetical protein [Streptomyces sp. XY431]KOV39004.1 hypothetical protein ADK60_01220 [Streptomyces sp. XY431]